MAKYEGDAPNNAATVLVVTVATFTGINWASSSPVVYTGFGAVVAVVCLCFYAKSLSTTTVPAKQLGLSNEVYSAACPSDEGFDTAAQDKQIPISSPDVAALTVSKWDWFADQVAKIYAVEDDGAASSTRCSEVFSNQQSPQDLKAALEQLHQVVESSGPEQWRIHEPIDDVYLTRVLIAVDFNTKKASGIAENYIKLRQQRGGMVVPPAGWVDCGLALVPFEDRRGRPVVFIRAKYHRPDRYKGDFIEAGVRSTLDAVMAHLLHKRDGLSETNPLERHMLVIDAKDCGWSNFSKDNLMIMQRDSTNIYTERLGKVVIVNVDRTIEFIWSQVVVRLLHPRTKRKVILERRGTTTPYLPTLIDPDILPRDYGGNADSFAEPGQADTLAGRVGAITAAVWERVGMLPEGKEQAIKVAFHEGNSAKDDRQLKFSLWMQDSGATAALEFTSIRAVAECVEFVQRLQGTDEQGRPSKPTHCGSCGSGCYIGFRSRSLSALDLQFRNIETGARELEKELNRLAGLGAETRAEVEEFVRGC